MVSRLAGGASSPVRAGAAVGGAPFVQAGGNGAYAIDTAGRRYVDYVMAYGPLLFGHAPPELVRGLDDVAAQGTLFGSTTAEEERLAARISAHLPSMEALRFVSTGTEAMMSAVRVARAYTERALVLRFAGNYHGHFDAALHDAGASARTGAATHSGVSASARDETIVARYNDLDSVDRLLAGREHELALIAVEPVAANMGLVLPDPGFLEGLFARARSCGALVLFDEVISWLRLGAGGAQGMMRLTPDLTALGKIMGGGFPLAAFGGRAAVMSVLAPQGGVFTGGTFSGNPFSIAMGHRVLNLIERDGLYQRLEARAAGLARGLRTIFSRLGEPYTVTQCASMIDFNFRPGAAVRNYDQAKESDAARFAAYYWEMRARGVLLAPSSNELMFVSTAHGEREIDLTLEAVEASLRALRVPA